MAKRQCEEWSVYLTSTSSPDLGSRLRHALVMFKKPLNWMSEFSVTSHYKAEFKPRRTNVKRLANQRLHFARDEVSDWLDARRLYALV
ncbi:hypothetical protein TNCV_4482111 [Trichonephila clavipes]|nr:hypothetical protein TNCV_4482111 [Trichonephila clavipes]